MYRSLVRSLPTSKCRSFLLPAALASTLIAVPVAGARTFNVPCDDSALSNAIQTANTNGEEDMIWLARSCVYHPATTLILGWDGGLAPITVHGRGAKISGSGLRTVFYVDNTANAFLENLIVTDGATTGDGGAIHNRGTLTITGSTVSGSQARTGGGIFTALTGHLTLIRSTVSGNTASEDGGGIRNDRGRLTVIDSTVSGNQALGTSGEGAGIYNSGAGARTTLTNCTVFGNASRFGAGIMNRRGRISVSHCTISHNISLGGGNGAGIYNTWEGVFQLSNTIVANGIFEYDNGKDCAAEVSIEPSGGNLIEDGSCGVFGALSGDPKLTGPVGSPATYPLLPGSPAIDAAANPECPNVDQVGGSRPRDGDGNGTKVCDLGALERP